MIGSRRVAASSTSSSSTQWHRKWRATANNLQRLQVSPLDPTVPHAETSAAGAARSAWPRSTPRRWQQRSFFSVASPSLSAVALGKQRAWEQTSSDVDRSVFAEDRSPVKHSDTLVPPIEQPGPDWTTMNDEVGWSTPEDVAHGGSLGELLEQDRRLIDESKHHQVLSVALDFAEPLVQRHLAAPNQRLTGMTALREQAEKVFDELYDELSSQVDSDSWSATVRPFSAADRRAFQIAFTATLRVLVVLQSQPAEICEKLDDIRQWLGPLPLPFYHRIVSIAGQCGRARLVDELFLNSLDAWNNRTDEWMLYTRSRALSLMKRHPARFELQEYWTVYQRFLGMQGSPRTALRAATRTLSPPRCLFTFLLDHFSTKGEDRRTSMLSIVSAMRTFGHVVDEAIWLRLVRANLTLRGHIPQEVAQDASSPEGETRYLFDLLGRRAEALASLDVVRMLQMINYEWQEAASAAEAEQSSARLFSPAQRAEAYTLAAEMFGRMRQPWRASVVLRRLWELGDEEQKQRAVIATMMAYAGRGQAERGLALARMVTREHFASDTDGSAAVVEATAPPLAFELPGTLPLSDRLFTSMLRCAALLSQYKDKVDAAYELLNMVSHQRRELATPVLRGLAAFLFAGLGSSHRYAVQGLRQFLARLDALSQHQAIEAPTIALRKKPRAGPVQKPIRCSKEASRNLAQIVRFARRMGLEHQMEVATHRWTWWRSQVNARQWEREREREASAMDSHRDPGSAAAHWMLSGSEDEQLQDDLSHSTAAMDVGSPREVVALSESSADQRQTTKPRRQARTQMKPVTKVKASRPRPHPSVDPAFQEDLSRPLSRPAYAHRLRVYAVVRRDHVSAAQVYRSMLSHGVRPGMMHVSFIVEGLARDGRLDEARAMIKAAQDSLGLVPSSRIRATLIRELLKRGKVEEAREQLIDHRAAGGYVSEQMERLFSARPTLADPVTSRKAFQIARRKQEPLPIADVDQAFQWLCERRRLVSAHRLLILALLSGTRLEWENIRRLVARGNWIWKLLRRRGIKVRASAIAGSSSQPFYARTLQQQRSEADNPEEDELQQQTADSDVDRSDVDHLSDDAEVDDAAVAEAIRADAVEPDSATQDRLSGLAKLYDDVSTTPPHGSLHARHLARLVEKDPLFSSFLTEAEDAAIASLEMGNPDDAISGFAGETSSSDLRDAWLLNRAAIFLSKRVVGEKERQELYAQKWFLVDVERLLLDAASGRWRSKRRTG
ncbi:hypothetical protein BDZ90DRAFT_186901 [Jaminaea rosea]|uniref:Pentacotripeptide-repeat region of PRORP domain-containing protein n=1 Tax=Jaminaea rosea TaxID=1569628 RepID=A0A316UPD3_9BASI|nr:hypothetical protein BDZ90DRAFT_186901 [Jaminaea rosea]PWN27140.1 hypothetical protein BDZ90DRAFT_186901 [Jaminaea rosea]